MDKNNTNKMIDFLPEATSFVGFVKHKMADWMSNGYVVCPLCDGYGGWNLTLNAYGENKHFNAFCRQCNGWGFNKANSKNEVCIHEMKQTEKLGRCYNRYTCQKCGMTEDIDSSD